jgi:hypothetical protein
MRKVFQSNYEAIHTFAQRTHPEGRNQSRSVFFEGDKIYSYGYHYLLGEFLDANTILINDKGYSNSTSKHISILSGATSQYKQYYKTRVDIDYIYNHVFNYLKPKLAKARKPQKYTSEIFSLWNSLNEYITERKETKTRRRKEYKQLLKFVDSLQDINTLKSLREWAKKEKEKKQRKEKRTLKEKLNKFYKYEIDFFRVGNLDYLRRSENGQYIETSQGVKIDIDEARRYYKILSSGANMRGEKISHYITKSFNDLLTIGCHNISKEQINRISKLL